MGEKSYGQMLVEGFVRAIPWAVVFSIATVVTANLLAPKVKGAIHYTIEAVMGTALSEEVFPKVKQNVKEAIEYTVKTLNNPPGSAETLTQRQRATSRK